MNNERGQSIILILIAMVALLAVIGLAIDGGRLHNNRRQAQNAADAAALAGARLLAQDACQSGGPADTDIRDAIVAFARSNGVDHEASTGEIHAWYVDADETPLHYVGNGNVPANTQGISLTTFLSDTTTFTKIIGYNDMQASAPAVAMVGPIQQMNGGVLPIAVPDEVVGAMNPGTHFTVFDNTDGRYCYDNPDDCVGETSDNADEYNNSKRGWLNLNGIYNGAHLTSSDPLNRTYSWDSSNAVLKEFAENGSPHPIFAGGVDQFNGDFIHGDPGARSSTLMEVYASWQGQTVYLPVFDHVYRANYMQDNFTPADGEANQDWPGNGSKNEWMYHIVGFVAVKIDNTSSNKELKGTLQRVIIGQGLIDPGGGIPCDNSLVGVTLWK